MKASITDMRKNMGKILKALDNNDLVTLTYRGREKATIVPKTQTPPSAADHSAFGMWKDRGDLQGVRKLRI